jgi:hypothetical protein
MGRSCSTHGETRNIYKTVVRNLKGRDYPEDVGVDGSILEWILEK